MRRKFCRNSKPFSGPIPDSHNLLWQREQLTGADLISAALRMRSAASRPENCWSNIALPQAIGTDAIVCPSHAVQSAIRSFWDLYGDYLHKRFGAPFRCPVQLPVIPLGIDCERFETITRQRYRAAQRQALGLGENDIVLLWVGRLSAAIKAHPLAMFQAAERAAEITGAPVHLIMVGYFMPEDAEEQFKKLAQDFCTQGQSHFFRKRRCAFS